MDWETAKAKEDGSYEIPYSWVFIHYYEAFNLLFRVENALRIFVYLVLKNEQGQQWADSQVTSEDGSEGTIQAIAKRRISQTRSFGYLGYPIGCPIMHLTSGELIRLIASDAYWKLFKEYFLGSKEIIKNKLEEIGSVRNSLAHLRPIKTDDVEVIKQNSKHALLGVEQYLSQALNQNDITPTNTTDSWYKELKTLGTDHCLFSILQSKDENWLRLLMKYQGFNLSSKVGSETAYYQILNIRSSAILHKYNSLTRHLSYLYEDVPFSLDIKLDAKWRFRKNIGMVFSRKVISEKYQEIKKELENLLFTISREADLIQQDNLARGEIVQRKEVSVMLKGKERKYWYYKTQSLGTPVRESDPPEYWGDIGYLGLLDPITVVEIYPWMSAKVSEIRFPF